MVSVAFFTTYARETTYPVELASILDDREDISVTIYTLFEVGTTTHDVDVECFDADGRLDIEWMRELYAILAGDEYDVFHTHPAVAGSLGRIIATLARFSPIVSTEHTTHENYGLLKRFVAGSTIGLNEVVVTNSCETLESLNWWEEKLVSLFGTVPVVIHNGIDIDAVTNAAAGDTPKLPDGFLIGTVGRLVPVKNHRLLVQTAAELIERHEDVSLVIVGDGPERRPLQNLAIDLGIEDRVVFTGQLSRPEVYAVLHDLDIFAFPSKHEGFGNAAVEAMAAGVPIVANDVPALREVLGDAGVFVDVADGNALADEFGELYRDDARRTVIGGAAFERATEFSIQKAADRHEELYRLLARNDSSKNELSTFT